MSRKPRKRDQLARERQQPRQHWIVGVETGFLDALGHVLTAIPPLHDLGEIATLDGTQPENLAQVAQGTAWSIHDHRGGDSGALAAVFFIDMLDDLLASIVLEIDIDVRRLAALL